MNDNEILQAEIPHEWMGQRLDQVLVRLFPDYSRSRLQTWLKQGQIRVNGEIRRAKDKVTGGEDVALVVQASHEQDWQAEDIPLNIVHEDAHILVINKPAGMVVHPAAGNYSGTLLNALLYYAPELQSVPRAGIVHRLDKDTTGLLVVARTLPAQKSLVEQLQARRFLRQYDAIVQGVLTAGGTVDAPIGRHPVNRKRMAVQPRGKPAVTHYRIAERFRCHTRLTVKLETGRTHQIRVHMAHIHHPLLGDPVYAGRFRIPPASSPDFLDSLKQFQRQALHARQLGLQHPHSGEYMEWQAEIPEDMAVLINALQHDMQQYEDGGKR